MISQLKPKQWSKERGFEAYNCVVSICLKYVSLPLQMVTSQRRNASEPCAWGEFYLYTGLKLGCSEKEKIIMDILLEVFLVLAICLLIYNDFMNWSFVSLSRFQ